ncbi:MAG: cupin domain-containing protein [Oscillospiraceae bacterium]|jgi:quercetin dioxygenase-like cupin family protein|nr:cupin domain-containing protein [Oscillospiraceae bacterium]
MKTIKGARWVFGNDIDRERAGEGVERQVLAYADEMMCVANHFEKGAVGAMHSHPHTQITYIVSGEFEFTIGEEKHIVRAGDTMLKQNGVPHGCVCLEAGIVLDCFNPMRKDFIM